MIIPTLFLGKYRRKRFNNDCRTEAWKIRSWEISLVSGDDNDYGDDAAPDDEDV